MREERASQTGLWRQVAHARQVGRYRASARARRSFCGRNFTYSLPSTKNTTFPPSTNTPPAKPTTALTRVGGSSAPDRVNSRTRPRFSFPATFFSVDSGWEVAKKRLFCFPGTLQTTQPKNFQKFIQSAYLANSPFWVFY